MSVQTPAVARRPLRAYGSSPVYVNGKRTFVEVPEEQAVIKRIVQERQAGTSIAAIVEALNAEGVPTVRGADWSYTTVHKLITREAARSPETPEPDPLLPSFSLVITNTVMAKDAAVLGAEVAEFVYHGTAVVDVWTELLRHPEHAVGEIRALAARQAANAG